MRRRSRAPVATILAVAVSVTLAMILLPFPARPGSRDTPAGLAPATPGSSDPPADPVLGAPGLDTLLGHANETTFTFTITYTSPSNSSPAHVNLTLVHETGASEHAMTPLVPPGDDFTSGVVFSITLVIATAGNHSHAFHASNGTATARHPGTGFLPGPSVMVPRSWTAVPFRWYNVTGETGPQVFTLGFPHVMFGLTFTRVQVSHYGFMRFVPPSESPRYDDIYQAMTLPSSESRSRYAFILWSQRIFDFTDRGSSDLVVNNEGSKFIYKQRITLNDTATSTKHFTMEYQFVLFPNQTTLVSIKEATFTNFTVNETIGFNHGNGHANIPFTYATNITNLTLLFDFSPVNHTRVAGFRHSPDSGDQNTAFTFSLAYQNLENILPHQVIVTVDGVNYTMQPANAGDTNVVDWKEYVYTVQHLNPNRAHAYSFHVHGPDGWYRSPQFDGPANVSWTSPAGYVGSKLAHVESHPWAPSSGWITLSAAITSVTLPFAFPFYGHDYTRVLASRQGFLRFSSNTSTAVPAIGGMDGASMLSIAMFNESIGALFVDSVMYKTWPDKIVFDFYVMTHGGQDLGDFQLILKSNGDIIFTFYYLTKFIPGGVNLGDGMTFTALPLERSDIPLENVSFIFMPYRANDGATVSSAVNGTLFTSSATIGALVTYASPANVPLREVRLVMNGTGPRGEVLPLVNESLAILFSPGMNFSAGIAFEKGFTAAPGTYTARFHVTDIFGNTFEVQLGTHQFTVNDPPVTRLLVQTPMYGGVGDTYIITVDYKDPEGLAPEFLQLVWNGIPIDMTPTGSDYAAGVVFTHAKVLAHGAHAYSIQAKDPLRPETVLVVQAKTITVYHKPVLAVTAVPEAMLLLPGTYRIHARASSPEGFPLLALYASINGIQNVSFRQDPDGAADEYIADVHLPDGVNIIIVVVSDGFNTVRWPVDAGGNGYAVTVINLPLILIVIGGGIGGTAIIAIQRKRSQAAALREKEEIKRRIQARRYKGPTEEEIEEKRLERLKELADADTAEAISQPVAPVKKSAAIKKATAGAASSSGGADHARTAKASGGGGGGTAPARDKSKYAPKADDTSTLLNKTVIKDYLARMSREGTTSLHYIKIKNDLGVISKKKSSRLYKLLQELVEKGTLVRKGSTYVIVG